MKREVYSKEKGKILSLLDMLREGHSLEYGLVKVFTNFSNPLVTSLEKFKEKIKRKFSSSLLRPVLDLLLMGTKINRKRTIEFSENLLEIFDRNFRLEQRVKKFRKSLLFRSYIVSAAIAGSLGVVSILMLFGFFQGNPIGGREGLSLIDLLNVFMTLGTSLSISFAIVSKTAARDKKERIFIFLIGFASFLVPSVLSYLLSGFL